MGFKKAKVALSSVILRAFHDVRLCVYIVVV